MTSDFSMSTFRLVRSIIKLMKFFIQNECGKFSQQNTFAWVPFTFTKRFALGD